MQRHPTNKSLIRLSPRQAELLELLASEPLTQKEIAWRLKLGVETIRTMVRNLCAELRVAGGRNGLVLFAIQNPEALKGGWIAWPDTSPVPLNKAA